MYVFFLCIIETGQHYYNKDYSFVQYGLILSLNPFIFPIIIIKTLSGHGNDQHYIWHYRDCQKCRYICAVVEPLNFISQVIYSFNVHAAVLLILNYWKIYREFFFAFWELCNLCINYRNLPAFALDIVNITCIVCIALQQRATLEIDRLNCANLRMTLGHFVEQYAVPLWKFYYVSSRIKIMFVSPKWYMCHILDSEIVNIFWKYGTCNTC